MSRYGYLISNSPLDFEITRVDCNRFFTIFFKGDNFCDFWFAFLTLCPIQKGFYSKSKELAPIERKFFPFRLINCVGDMTTRQPLWVILCHLPHKGRKEIEEIEEEMKERGSEERGTGMKVKKKKK